MKYNISKELFEAVMEIETKIYDHISLFKRGVFEFDSVKHNDTLYSSIFYESRKNDGTGCHSPVNISVDSFFFKCKEWAYNKNDYILTSWKDRDCYYCEIDNNLMSFSDDLSEQQAVFDACQWILENKGE